jgi:hypothetical protein
VVSDGGLLRASAAPPDVLKSAANRRLLPTKECPLSGKALRARTRSISPMWAGAAQSNMLSMFNDNLPFGP